MFEHHTKVSVKYRTEILEGGQVVAMRDFKRNLVLDTGLDYIGTTTDWETLHRYCVVGNGTTPTKRDSGAITFTRAGNVVTANDSFFIAGDVKRLLKFDSGEEMYVNTVNSATSATVSVSGPLSASEGTLWYVEQTRLTNELKRTSYNGSLDNTTVFDGTMGTLRCRHTFLFPVETGNVLYTELGWSPNGSTSASIFGRDLIPGGGDALVANQQYRVTVDLYVSFAPATPQTIPFTVTGREGTVSSLQQQVEDVSYFIPGRFTSSVGVSCVFQTAVTALRPIGYKTNAPILGTGISFVEQPYVAGSFQRDLYGTNPGSASGLTLNNICGVAFGYPAGSASWFRVLFDQPFNKGPYDTLTVSARMSWNRVLIN
jgi:hypothetical protein